MNAPEGLDVGNVIQWEGRPKRALKPRPLTYWEEYVATDKWYQTELVSDVPEDEMFAACEDDDLQDDDGEEEDEDEDDEDSEEEDDDFLGTEGSETDDSVSDNDTECTEYCSPSTNREEESIQRTPEGK